MDILIKNFAIINLFLIFLIIFGGFAFLKIIKRNLLD